jgi:cobalt/nickel transport system permease protein
MHISDGVLNAPVLIGGFIGTAALTVATMRKMELEEIPKISVITSVFFVSSLIHVPIGPTSVHLILNGLAGVVLGWRAFPAILVGLILQAILFGHGGVTVIGVNTLMMGGGGLIAYMLWRQRRRFNFKRRELVFGAIAGAAGVASSGIILALALITTGEVFHAVAGAVLLAHIPVIIIEAGVVGASAEFLSRVKPDVLADNHLLVSTKPT